MVLLHDCVSELFLCSEGPFRTKDIIAVLLCTASLIGLLILFVWSLVAKMELRDFLKSHIDMESVGKNLLLMN